MEARDALPHVLGREVERGEAALPVPRPHVGVRHVVLAQEELPFTDTGKLHPGKLRDLLGDRVDRA